MAHAHVHVPHGPHQDAATLVGLALLGVRENVYAGPGAQKDAGPVTEH